MTCEEIQQLGVLERYLAGKLSDTETADFESHYLGCAECFEALEAANAIRAGFRVLEQQSAGWRPTRQRGRVRRAAVLLAATIAIAFCGFR